MDGNVSFISEIVEKGNLSNGYFYERNGITRLGIKVFFLKFVFLYRPKSTRMKSIYVATKKDVILTVKSNISQHFLKYGHMAYHISNYIYIVL